MMTDLDRISVLGEEWWKNSETFAIASKEACPEAEGAKEVIIYSCIYVKGYL